MTQINVVKQKDMHLFHSYVVIINQKLMIDRNDSGITTYNEKEDKCAQIGTD
jgi:hypothetical protein